MIGKYCNAEGITTEYLEEDNFKKIQASKFLKGIALELFLYAKTFSQDPTTQCSIWFSKFLNVDLNSIEKASLKTKLYKLHQTKKSTQGGRNKTILLNGIFTVPVSTISSPKFESLQQKTEYQTEKEPTMAKYTNLLLKRKLTRAKIAEKKKSVQIKRLKLNVKEKDSEMKCIKRELKKLHERTGTHKESVLKNRKLEKEICALKKKLSDQDRVVSALTHRNQEIETMLVDGATSLEAVKQEKECVLIKNRSLSVDIDYLQTLLEDNSPLDIFDESRNSFTPDLTECVMNLLDCNVAAQNVSQVIRSVSKLCGRVPNRLPSRQTVDRINDQRIYVSSKQIESLAEKRDLTLYSDETSKFGRSFEVFAVSDSEKNTYLLGLREMYSKNSVTVLDTFKQILHDISEISSGTNTGDKIMANIKNTMSDRAASEKKFHSLLEDYRKDILPKVKDGWEVMNDIERDNCIRMNNFFCGLHLLVNFADVCALALLKYEKLSLKPEKSQSTDDSGQIGDSKEPNESGTVRLIRTSSKAFSRGVDEKSGVFGPFKTYLESKNDKVKFQKFQHNRFNVLFLLGEIIYHHRNNMEDFLENKHGTTNRLLISILQDIKIPTYVAGCRALGIVSKFVTSPLWKIIENSGHIMEMADVYSNLLEFLEMARKDSSDVLSGSVLLFADIPCFDEELIKSEPELDIVTAQILQCLFEAMYQLLKRQASDHLPEGKFFTGSKALWDETSGTIKHNKLPEFFFGQLDFFMKYRPNATTLCNEAFLLFSHNKTGEWLAKLPEDEKNCLLQDSKSEGRAIRKQFQIRLKDIEAKRIEILKSKERELKERKERIFKQKEKMTNEILYFGLWQSVADVESHLAEIPSITEKIKAIKSQLSFRKKVLHQAASDKSLFSFSMHKKKKTLKQLKDNLIVLISEAREGPATEVQCETPLLVNKHIRHKFDDVWYDGQVLSVVPSFIEWYNVKYDNDPAIYVYKLQEDYASGDLAIVPLQTM